MCTSSIQHILEVLVLAGIWCTSKKPPTEMFLRPLIELKSLASEGCLCSIEWFMHGKMNSLRVTTAIGILFLVLSHSLFNILQKMFQIISKLPNSGSMLKISSK